MKLVRVESDKSLCRDVSSGAIVNVNNEEYREHMAKKAKILEERKKKEMLESEINNLKKEFSEIKQLLLSLLEEKKNANQ